MKALKRASQRINGVTARADAGGARATAPNTATTTSSTTGGFRHDRELLYVVLEQLSKFSCGIWGLFKRSQRAVGPWWPRKLCSEVGGGLNLSPMEIWNQECFVPAAKGSMSAQAGGWTGLDKPKPRPPFRSYRRHGSISLPTVTLNTAVQKPKTS